MWRMWQWMMLTSQPSTDWQPNWRRDRVLMNWSLWDRGSSNSTTGDTHLQAYLTVGCSVFHWKCLVSSRWSKFQGDLSSYKKKLEGALAFHALIRELEEVRDRANEKVSHLTLPESCRSDLRLETDRTVSSRSVLCLCRCCCCRVRTVAPTWTVSRTWSDAMRKQRERPGSSKRGQWSVRVLTFYTKCFAQYCKHWAK